MSVRRSLAWTYSAQAIAFFITFASTVVVARLVSPRDFGIFAMAGAITTIINVLLQFGLTKFVVREAELSRDTLRSVFTVNVMMSFLYAGSIFLGSGVARHFLDSPEIAEFLMVFAFFPLLAMMEFIPSSLCAREMRFGTIAMLSVVRAVVMAITTIALAAVGYAYMSFAWAQVLAWAATAVGFNIIVWRPDLWRLRFKGIRSILHFGSQMIGISGINQLSTRAGEMALGSLLGLSALGLYNRAVSLPTSIYTNVFGASSNVLFSRMSQELRDAGKFDETYIRFMRLVIGLLWPMMFGIATLAQPIIHILYGAKWQAAATPLSLLTIASAITVAIGMTSEIFILRHEMKRQIRIETIRAVMGLTLFMAGAMVSLTVAAAAKIAESVIAFALYRRPMDRLVAGAADELQRVYGEGALLAAAAVAPSLAMMIWWEWSPKTPILHIVSAVAIGVFAWVALLVARHHPIVTEIGRLRR